MKTILKTLLLLLTSSVTSQAVGFFEAASGGQISWSGTTSYSYSETKITVRNTRTYAVDVDFSTVSFVQNNNSQRIGLAYERTTGSYYLRLSANSTYTLYFSSRCLDESRSTPSTGVSFGSCRAIPSSCSAIISALRGNYTQSSVWSITERSSTTAAWRASDPRNSTPPPPPPAAGPRMARRAADL